jgi:acyl carrier protein
MDSDYILHKVEGIFRELFQDITELKPETNSGDMKGWDSLNHVLLITRIEKEFGLKFSLDEMLSMRSFGDICTMVQSKI